MNNWQRHIDDTKDLLLSLSVRDMNGKDIDTDTAFKQLKNYTLGVLERRKTIYFIGNGSSASIANEVSANLVKNTGIRTETFFNFSLITAIASDSGYEDVFAEPLRKRMVAGDMLVAISSTGESQNVIYAAKEARNLGGNVCTLSAMNPANTLRAIGTLNFYIPAASAWSAHLCHMEVTNYWTNQMISMVSWQEDLKNSTQHGSENWTGIGFPKTFF